MSYRYIIIGAGSAGCVLANRLSADPAHSVLLLEAGGRDWHPLIHMPAGLAYLVNSRQLNWHCNTEPEPYLNNRRLYWPRGRVLGGSSSVNAMCYVRGQPQDYDAWAAAGNDGWRFADVLPYFKLAERQQHGASPLHGASGLLSVEDLRDRNPLSDVFVKAGMSIGLPYNADFNGEQQLGVGYYQVTQRNGRRCSSAVAYLRQASQRRNLSIATHALVERIVIRNGRAVEVVYRRGSERQTAHCDGEVLLCAGSVRSPQVLMLSGIGDAAQLHEHGISVTVELPGVGANLQDHLDVCTLYKSTQPISYDFNLWQEAQVALRYFFSHRGPGVSNVAEAGGFACSQYTGNGRPDIQLHFVPAQLDDHGRNRLPGHGFTMHSCYLRPRSRGSIRLRSADVANPPRIFANYLQDGHDLSMTLAAARLAHEILNARPFDAFRGKRVFPTESAQSPEDLTRFIRDKAESIYHPVGTCRMGGDALAVVDSKLRVRGVDGLRVIDASIMPTIVSGNTNAPTIMIAEKAARMILGATPLLT